MASRIIASTPKDDAATLHAYAISALQEWRNELEKLFAVAAAGRIYCGESQPIQQNLFGLIEDMLADVALGNLIRERIDALARLAGAEVLS